MTGVRTSRRTSAPLERYHDDKCDADHRLGALGGSQIHSSRGNTQSRCGAARARDCRSPAAPCRASSQVRQIGIAVAVGECFGILAFRDQLAQAARLLLAAPVGSGQRAVEPIAVPAHAGARSPGRSRAGGRTPARRSRRSPTSARGGDRHRDAGGSPPARRRKQRRAIVSRHELLVRGGVQFGARTCRAAWRAAGIA